MLYYSSSRSAILQWFLSPHNLYDPFRGGRFVDRIFRVPLVSRVEDNPPACFISENIICGFIHEALVPAMISMSRRLAQWLNITLCAPEGVFNPSGLYKKVNTLYRYILIP